MQRINKLEACLIFTANQDNLVTVFTTFILYCPIRIGRLTDFFNNNMFDFNPGKSSIVIHYGIASSSYIHLRPSCCTCDFLCSNHSFWKHKGKFHLLSLWFLWFHCHVEFYFFQIPLLSFSVLMFDTCLLWFRSINGKVGRIMLRIWNTIQRELWIANT